MHELSIYKRHLQSGLIISYVKYNIISYNKNRASPEADGKWLESPRSKIFVGHFPKLKDVHNSCSAKYRIATIAKTEDTSTHRFLGF